MFKCFEFTERCYPDPALAPVRAGLEFNKLYTFTYAKELLDRTGGTRH